MEENLDWRIVGASVMGTSHVKTGTPCQDAHLYTQLNDGILIAVTSDGAGSAVRSIDGANLAVETLTHYLITALEEETPTDSITWLQLIEESFLAAMDAVHRLSQEENLSPRDFACTLTLAIVGEDWLATGIIGDGAVVARDMDGNLFTAAYPQRGEYAGETYFITMPNAMDYLEGGVLSSPIQALAVMTDGLTRLAFSLPAYDPHKQFFTPLLDFPLHHEDMGAACEQLAVFLNSDRVNARTDDDKTLILAARPAWPEPGFEES